MCVHSSSNQDSSCWEFQTEIPTLQEHFHPLEYGLKCQEFLVRNGERGWTFFSKFCILFKTCWVVEVTSDLGHIIGNLNGAQRTMRALVSISGFSFTMWDVINLTACLSENSWEQEAKTYGAAVGNHQSHQPSCPRTFKWRVFHCKGFSLTKGPGCPWEHERSEIRIKILATGVYKNTLQS